MGAKRWTLVAVILGSGTVFLESSVVPLALPQIGRDLPSTLLRTLEAQSYVYYAYLLSLSSLLILAGALTDYHGRRRMFLLGLVGFAATSLLCAMAPNMELLIAFRVLQGASGALLVPGSLSIITATFEGEEQGRAFGIWAGASALTTILGPVLGGALVAAVSWRAAFFVSVPLMAIAAWATLRYMAETKDEEATGHFDVPGAVAVALAVGGLTFGAIRGQAQEWETTGPFVALAVGAAAAAAFPFLMKRSPHPLVPLKLFRSRNFTVTNVSTLLIYASIYLLIQFLSLFAVGVLGYSEAGFGAATIPTTIFLAFFSTRFGVLADRHGPRLFMALGPALMAVGLLWLTRVPAESEPWRPSFGAPSSLLPPADYLGHFLPALALFGIGLMVMVAPLTAALMRSVPVANSGVASAFNNAVSRVGPQLGGALIFIFISATFYGSLQEALPQVETGARTFREYVSPLNPPPEDVEPAVQEAALHASTEAFHVAMLVAALMCFAGAAVNAAGIDNSRATDAAKLTAAPPVAPCPPPSPSAST